MFVGRGSQKVISLSGSTRNAVPTNRRAFVSRHLQARQARHTRDAKSTAGALIQKSVSALLLRRRVQKDLRAQFDTNIADLEVYTCPTVSSSLTNRTPEWPITRTVLLIRQLYFCYSPRCITCSTCTRGKRADLAWLYPSSHYLERVDAKSSAPFNKRVLSNSIYDDGGDAWRLYK
eukprot:Lankesteria_metandrocarpae@DN11000_c0_g1_i1.p1